MFYNRSHEKEPSLNNTNTSRSSIDNDEILTTQRRTAVIPPSSFSLSSEDNNLNNVHAVHMAVTQEPLTVLTTVSTEGAEGLSAYLFTPSLDPQRSPSILSKEIFELLESQLQFDSASLRQQLLKDTALDTLNKGPRDISNTPTPSPSLNGLSSSQDGVDTLWNVTESKSRVRSNHTKSWGDKIGDLPRPSTVSTGERNRDREREICQDNDRSNGRSKSAGRSRKVNGVKVSSSVRGLSSSAELRFSQIPKGTECTIEGNLVRTSSSTIPVYTLTNPTLDDALPGDTDKDIKDLVTCTGNLSIYEGIPVDVTRLSEGDKEAIQGIWLAPHPLQLQSVAMMESLHAVSDWNRTGLVLSLEKQISWQLDLLRVHDAERMERFEAFLCSKRSPNIEDQLKARSVSLKGPTQRLPHTALRRQKIVPVIEYYKDKGRQATK